MVTRAGANVKTKLAETSAAAIDAAAAPARRARLTRLGLIHRQSPDLIHLAVQLADGALGLLVVGHLHEPEAARAVRVAVDDDLGTGDLAERREHFAQLVAGALPR